MGLTLRGAIAAATSLAVLATAQLFAPELDFPPVQLASWLVRITPGNVATFFIERFQHDAQKLLTVAAVAGLVAIGAVLPLLVRRLRSSEAAPLCGVIFGVLLALSDLVAPVRPSLLESLAPAVAGGLCYGVVLGALERVPWTSLVSAEPPDLGRREALRQLGSAVGALFLAGGLLTLLGRVAQSAAGAVRLARPDRPAPRPSRAPFPAAASLPPEVTSPEDHYVVEIDLVEPRIDASSWRLRVDGLVAQPLELGFAEMQSRFETVEEISVLTCVSNVVGGPLIGNSAWTGVRLADVLEAARPRRRARSAVFSCADGYTVTVPLRALGSPHNLLALGQGGRPLLREHGSPCRARIPALYGMMNAKWLEQITLVPDAPLGYWAQRGWSRKGIVRTQSRIDALPAEPRTGHPTWITGVAWAGERGISGVEVSTDGGSTWNDALLREPLSSVAWRQWALRWTPDGSGNAELVCRATDGQEKLQTARRSAPHPAGASGWHSVSVEVL